MVFSGIPFLFFCLPLVLALYYIVPFRFKNTVLMVFSLVFYAWGEPVWILALIALAMLVWLCTCVCSWLCTSSPWQCSWL